MNHASAYLVATPELKPPARIVPMIAVALVHVAVIAALVKGLTVLPSLHKPDVITVVETPPPTVIDPTDDPPPRQLPTFITTPPLDNKVPPTIDIETPPVADDPPPITIEHGLIGPPRTHDVIAVMPKLLRKNEPPYPPDARRRNEEGLVTLRLTIAANGRVTDAQLKQSSGVKSLDQAALESVRSWIYSPAKHDGVAVSESISVLIRFSLTSV